MDTVLYTLPEAAERARLSVRTMRHLLKNGSGPAVTRLTGGRGKILVRADVLGRWIEDRTQGMSHAD